MHITIENKIIRENIQAFLDLLRRAEAKREKKGAALVEKAYKAFLHRISGRLVFADAFKEQIEFKEGEWKALYIDYSYDPFTECFSAAVFETEDKNTAFQLEDLKVAAMQAIKETISILNRLSFLVKGSDSDLITKIKAFCKLQIDIGSHEKDKNIIVAAWHSVDRIETEKLLQGRPIGTFLFREDYFAKLLEEQLSEQSGKKIKCITLSVLESENKVSDFTLVHIDHQWRCYDDALFCRVQGFEDIEDLLKTCFNGRLTEPLYHIYEQRIA